jgi:mRNA-degrading endonuclease toxin of MazEF toxin-antitoxin module
MRRLAARLSKVNRGEIYHVDLSPTQGREQVGARYVLIVSPRAFNILGTPLVCPITQGGNFARVVEPNWTPTQGVIPCSQARVIDLLARKAGFVERVLEFIVGEVFAKRLTLIK